MVDVFFKIKAPFEKLSNQDSLISHFKKSNSLKNVLYQPDSLSNVKITGVSFENVSFSKTKIYRVTFRDCTFKNCLFIGTEFSSVEIHQCNFVDCNFFKVKLVDFYARPSQFFKAIPSRKYSNIAVSFYHSLRENYYKESQREFKNESEVMFLRWNRINKYDSAKKNRQFLSGSIKAFFSWLFDILFGYGYRLRNIAVTSTILMISLMLINYHFSKFLFPHREGISIVETVYFTITTMATLGASGYAPSCNFGYILVLSNLALGITLFSAAISVTIRKIFR